MEECYICLEPTSSVSPCVCVKRHLCANCLQKLKLYEFDTCTVCRSPFPEEPRAPRIVDRLPQHCVCECFSHVFVVVALCFLFSCALEERDMCYGLPLLDYVFTSIVVYLVFIMVMRSVLH